MSEVLRHFLILIIQIFTGYVPQGFLILLFVYAACKRRVDRHYVIGGILLSIGVALIRIFPIFKGSDIILNILCLICIAALFCKLPVDKTIIFSLVVAIMLLLIELLLVLFYTIIFGGDFLKSKDDLQWALFGIPSSTLLTPIVLLYYRFVMRKGAKNVGGSSKKGSEQDSYFPEL